LKIRPSEYDAMDRQEKAFIIASIQVKQQTEKEQEKKMNVKKPRRK
jgi:hypothetical protein